MYLQAYNLVPPRALLASLSIFDADNATGTYKSLSIVLLPTYEIMTLITTVSGGGAAPLAAPISTAWFCWALVANAASVILIVGPYRRAVFRCMTCCGRVSSAESNNWNAVGGMAVATDGAEPVGSAETKKGGATVSGTVATAPVSGPTANDGF
jgi:hypothetical protein